MNMVSWLWAGVVAVLLAILACSCATITPTYNPNGELAKIEASKFMADLEYEEEFEFAPDGKLLKRRVKYKTGTVADKLIDSSAALLGELFNGAGKVMP
jgi:hypothetical protein